MELDKKKYGDMFAECIAENRIKLKKCTNKKNRLQKEIDEINKIFSSISNLENKISSKNTEISHHNDYIDKLEKLSVQIQNDVDLQEKRFEELQNRETTLKDAVKSVSDDNINLKIIDLQNDIEELDRQISDLIQAVSDANSNIGAIKARIQTRTEDLAKLELKEKSLKELEDSYFMHKQVRKAFSSSGIPAMIINTILDDLQIEANQILSELKRGLEVQFTPELDLIFRIDGKAKEYKLLSGGQKMDIAFALKIGLSLIIQKRMGVNIRFLGLDEVDQPLDKATVDTFADMIMKLQNRFKIFVITHNDTLKDKFNNVILVEGGDSRGASAKLMTY